jgi:hypothetical protein
MKKLTQNFLFIYSLVLSVAFAVTLIVLFRDLNASKKSFTEIEAQQIKIIEPDGTLRMVISNSRELPGVLVHGKETEKIDRPQAGMLFYNDEGSENGGLIFSGSKNASGQVVNSGGSLSFDRYEGNQEVQLIGVNDKENNFAGLMVSESHPKQKSDPPRIWIGRNDDGSSEIALMDSLGRKRLIFEVLENGNSSISFLDQSGKTVNSMGPTLNN